MSLGDSKLQFFRTDWSLGSFKHGIQKPTFVQRKIYGLDTFPYRNIIALMARAATTTDVFNAIAEPRRREIIDMLVDGRDHAVGDVVKTLRISQPAVSKHLGVLRK